MRTVSIAGAALAVLILGSALSACATPGGNAADKEPAATSSPATSSPMPSAPRRSSPPSHPVAVPPDIAVVRLGTGFSPGSLRLSVGQQFMLIVNASVQAKGLDAAGCGSAASATAVDGLLSVRCVQGGYLYTAEHSGTGIISATVGPRCNPGQMCAQWLAEPRLHVAIA